LIKAIPQCKNIHFAEEEEWRLLGNFNQHKDDPLLCEINGIHRLSFNLDRKEPDGRGCSSNPLAMVEIMAGPKTDLRKLEHFVAHEFRKMGFTAPKVSQAEIPVV